jgi:hypothetical protein
VAAVKELEIVPPPLAAHWYVPPPVAVKVVVAQVSVGVEELILAAVVVLVSVYACVVAHKVVGSVKVTDMLYDAAESVAGVIVVL